MWFRIILFFAFFLSHQELFPDPVASRDSVNKVFNRCAAKVNAGDYRNLSDTLRSLLRPEVALSEIQRFNVNVYLGMINSSNGQLTESLAWFKAAEGIYDAAAMDKKLHLANLYIHQGVSWHRLGNFDKALIYYEKASRILLDIKDNRADQYYRNLYLSEVWSKIGSVYYDYHKYPEAIKMFTRILALKEQIGYKNVSWDYYYMAITFDQLGDKSQAVQYYELAIDNQIEQRGDNSDGLGEFYRSYGRLLLSMNEVGKGLRCYEKAVQNLRLNHGDKGAMLSSTYLLQGNYYRSIGDFTGALYHYQKALIAVSPSFNNRDVLSNPAIDNSLLDFSLLYALRRKSEALKLYADATSDKPLKKMRLTEALQTIEPAVELINNMRVDFESAGNRMFFTGSHKHIIVSAIESALALYDLTREGNYLEKAYRFARQCKSNELKYEQAREAGLMGQEISDTLKGSVSRIEKEIADCQYLLDTGVGDTVKINFWKDRLFDLNREREKVLEQIDRQAPVLNLQLKNNEVEPLRKVQGHLQSGESLLEYVFAPDEEEHKARLFIFVITPKTIDYKVVAPDSADLAGFDLIRKESAHPSSESNALATFNRLGTELNRAYRLLIAPVEKQLSGEKLVIIPDERLAYLPFEALVASFHPTDRVDYSSLDYLINRYTISYAYLANGKIKKVDWLGRMPRVAGFAPDYERFQLADGSRFKPLKETVREINAILKWFNGKAFQGDAATRTNFRLAGSEGKILHLAMHAETNQQNAGLSYLAFAPEPTALSGAKLFNYEIGQMKIASPMVVLSACDTGNGLLYSGEGVLSLARNFIVAGVPSVVETLWPVEDVAGSKIMESFYHYLSEGKTKDEALKLAKIDYLNTTSPSFVHPHFWASYALIGDHSALVKQWWQRRLVVSLTLILLVVVIGLLIYRFRSFRIF